MINVLFVSSEDICRSPVAKLLFKELVKKYNMTDRFFVDSAGISNKSSGKPADNRVIKMASKRGLNLTNHLAKQITQEDFLHFDHIIAFDTQTYTDIMKIITEDHQYKVTTILSYNHTANFKEIVNPFFGNEQDFELMFNLLETYLHDVFAGITKNDNVSDLE